MRFEGAAHMFLDEGLLLIHVCLEAQLQLLPQRLLRRGLQQNTYQHTHAAGCEQAAVG